MNPGPEKLFNRCLLNARAVRNETTLFIDFVMDGKFHLVAVTETYLNPSDTESTISGITPPG